MSAQYFAQIDADNVVTHVSVVQREFLEANPDRYTGTWVETFVDVEGKIYAGKGFVYDHIEQNFIPPYIKPAPELPVEE